MSNDMKEQEGKNSWAYIDKSIAQCKVEANNRTKEEDEQLAKMAESTRLWEDWRTLTHWMPLHLVSLKSNNAFVFRSTYA